jgi:hypothetical protein
MVVFLHKIFVSTNQAVVANFFKANSKSIWEQGALFIKRGRARKYW